MIERKVKTRDADGGELVTWEPYLRRWANVETLSAREYFAAQQTAMEVTHQVTMRVDATIGLKPGDHRILHGDLVLDIDAIVDAKGRGREWALQCRELVHG